MIKAVLFDFDGTLINTNDLIFASYKKAFNEVLKREISMDEMLKLYGRPLRPSLLEYGEDGERLYEIYREFNERNHDRMAKSFDGVYSGVKKIKDMGFKIGIVTSKRMHLIDRGLKLLKMDNMFEVIVTPDDTEKTKPDPEPILCGCSRLGLTPEEVIYVGDSIFDMQSGRSAGTKLCAVKYSLTDHKKLLEFAPEFFVDTIDELAHKLEGNN